MPIQRSSLPGLMALALLLAGCGQQSAEPPAEATADDTAAPAAEPMAAAEPAMPSKSAAPDGARVFFITPADGDTVSSPVTVEFGIESMEVVRAGVASPNSGHHHLLVDTDLPDLGMPVPADENHIHFGDASTSTTLELEPGEHTLQLLLGDHLHIPHDPPVMSDRITITVE